MSPYAYLAFAVIAEVIATTALKASDVFVKPGPAFAAIAGYGVAFYFLAIALQTIPVGVAYALWSGAGILLIATIGALWFGQKLDGPALVGLGLIIAGVLITRLLSNASLG